MTDSSENQENAEVIGEFLHEGLDQLDQDLVQPEQSGSDQELLGRIFRCVHTIKGRCCSLGFGKLESVAHVGEILIGRGATTAGVIQKALDTRQQARRASQQEARALSVAEGSIRVDVPLLDRLMNLVGDLVLPTAEAIKRASKQLSVESEKLTLAVGGILQTMRAS